MPTLQIRVPWAAWSRSSPCQSRAPLTAGNGLRQMAGSNNRSNGGRSANASSGCRMTPLPSATGRLSGPASRKRTPDAAPRSVTTLTAKEIVDAAGADDVTYVEMKGAPHYLEGHRREALATVADWLAKRFP